MSNYEFPRVGRIPQPRKANAPNVWTKAAPGASKAAATLNSGDELKAGHLQQHRAPSLKSVRIHSAGPSTSTIIHPLKHDYIMSCGHRSGNQRLSEADWEQSMKRLTSFGSVESFWNVWTHIKRPSQLPPITDIYIFKLGIAPKWEDPGNVNGGKFVLRLKKGLADRIFESLVLAMIGQQLEPGPPASEDLDGEHSSSSPTPTAAAAAAGSEDEEEICGCVLSVRTSEDIISIWNRSRSAERREALRRTIQARLAELKLPLNEKNGLAYKPHHDHLKNHNNPSSTRTHHHHHQHSHSNSNNNSSSHRHAGLPKRSPHYDIPRAAESIDEALEAELREA